MEHIRWPPPLRERLGDGGAMALEEVLNSRDEDVLNAAAERFGRRLSEECEGVRTDVRAEMRELGVQLREEMRELGVQLRGEMRELGVGLHGEVQELRTELRGENQDLRTEMHRLQSDVKVDLADARADLLKWSFLFWIGQVAAVTGLMTILG